MSATGRTLCVLISGGLDSALLVHRLVKTGHTAVPLYVRCGLYWEDAELYWLRRYLRAIHGRRLKPLTVLEMPLKSVYGAHWSLTGRRVPSAASSNDAVYLPGRNVFLLTAAAVEAARLDLSTLALGVLKGNPFGDATPHFFSKMAAALSAALSHPIRIKTPLAGLNKLKLIRDAKKAPLGLSFSCIHPHGKRHCGACNKCGERQRAFLGAGIEDPTRYAS